MKKDKIFDEYIEKYKQLKIKDKRDVIIDLLIEDITTMDRLLTKKGINTQILYNKEIEDIKNDNYNEDDFLEATLVYLYSMRELLSEYIKNSEGDI